MLLIYQVLDIFRLNFIVGVYRNLVILDSQGPIRELNHSNIIINYFAIFFNYLIILYYVTLDKNILLM